MLLSVMVQREVNKGRAGCGRVMQAGPCVIMSLACPRVAGFLTTHGRARLRMWALFMTKNVRKLARVRERSGTQT